MKHVSQITIWMAGVALAALMTESAHAGEPSSSVVEIDQVQLDDVWSNMTVEIETHAWDATSASTAVGNAAAALVTQGDIDVDVIQSQDGSITADNSIQGGSAGLAVATTTAYGNSTTGGTWSGDNYYRAEQVSDGDIAANTAIAMDGAGTIVSATTAIANVSVPADEYGKNAAFQIQEANGSVTATTDADLCCDGHSASFGTTAGGNAISSSGSSSTNVNGAVQTTSSGATMSATTDVYVNDGHNVLAATTAFGNSASVHNEWGYATLGRPGSEVFQGNDASVQAETYVTLDDWSGYGTASAYGVGNAATISNVGSDTGLNAIQNNYGAVSSSVSFNGTSTHEGDAVATATSIGNATTATLCNICGDAALQGRTQQFNAGTVTAFGTASVGQAGSVYGSATAVGNAATYQSTGQ